MSRPSSICSDGSLLNDFNNISLTDEQQIQQQQYAAQQEGRFVSSSPHPDRHQQPPAGYYGQQQPQSFQQQAQHPTQDYGRSITPINGTSSYLDRPYEQMSYAHTNLQRNASLSMSQSFDPTSYSDNYNNQRYDMNRSYQNMSMVGTSQPIMSTMPFGSSNTYPFQSSMAYGNPLAMSAYPTQQPSGLNAMQEWMVKYNQWWHYMNNQRIAQARQQNGNVQRERLTPHLFSSARPHARVSFGGLNQLLVVNVNNVLIQQIDPSLIDVGTNVQISTWPGPFIKGEDDKPVDPASILEYIRTQEGFLRSSEQLPQEFMMSHQKRQIWLLLSMLVRQTGVISGADLSELLLLNNESEFEATDDGTDIAKLRRYLMLGQRKTALEFAAKSGLWGHAFALTHLSSGGAAPKDNKQSVAQMSNMVSKFINASLSREDPLFVLLRCLLQKCLDKSNNKLVPTANLQQFAILLANDCEVSPTITSSSQSSELLKFIVALRTNSPQYLVNLSSLDAELNYDSKLVTYSDELVFVNEIWEFARKMTDFIEALVPLKLVLASRLFDYGFIEQATAYCYQIGQYYRHYGHYNKGRTIEDSRVNWEFVMKVVIDMENRMYGFDVRAGAPDQEVARDAQSVERDDESSDAGDESESVDDDDGDDQVDQSEQPAPPPPVQEVRKDPPVQKSPVKKPTTFPQATSAPTTNNLVAKSVPAPVKAQPAFFVPAPPPATSAANEPFDLNFLSVSAPAPNGHSEEHESGDTSDLRLDGRLSAPPDDEVHQWNSTAAVNNFPPPGGLGAFSAPFSPINSPEPQSLNQTAGNFDHHQGQQSFGRNGAAHRVSESESKQHNHQQNQQQHNQQQNQQHQQQPQQSKQAGKGMFSSFMEKILPKGPNQAVLPDDNDQSIYYDKELKRWVDKNDPSDGGAADAIASGPPKMPMPGMRPGSFNGQPSNAPPAAFAPQPPPSSGSSPSAPGSFPPQGPPSSASPPLASPTGAQMPPNNFSFVKSSRAPARARYVDVWQTTQQQKAS